MADMKISALGAASVLGGTELLAGVQSGGSVKITPAQILAYILAAASMTEGIQDTVGSFMGGSGPVSVSYNDAGNALTVGFDATNAGFVETVQDMLATFLVAGTGIGLTYNDAGNALTIASTGLKSNYTTLPPGASNDSTQGYSVGSFWFDSVAGLQWRCLDASAGAAVWYAGGASDHPGYVSGLYYPAQRSALVSGVAVVADTLYACPIYIAQRVTLSGLGIRNGTGVASTAVKLGLYANSAGRPGALIAAGTGGAATTSNNSDAAVAFASNVVVAPGLYWIAAIFNGAPTPFTIGTADQLLSTLIGGSTMGNTSANTGQVTGVTGAGATYTGGLPSSFGTATIVTGSASVPLGNIKIA